MSYSFDGKLVNQQPKCKNLAEPKTLCEKCSKLIDFPKREVTKINSSEYFTFNYIGSEFFIYETKGHRAVTYCSQYCRNKHNHRFKDKK